MKLVMAKDVTKGMFINLREGDEEQARYVRSVLVCGETDTVSVDIVYWENGAVEERLLFDFNSILHVLEEGEF